METLQLIRTCDDGNAFVCKVCMYGGASLRHATLRSENSACNVYSHFRLVQSEMYALVEPIVQSREKNKRPKTQLKTLTEVLVRSRQRVVDDALLCLFSAPDELKRLLESVRFKFPSSVDGVRNRTNDETLERDAVVFA